jgi:hypothetical protein
MHAKQALESQVAEQKMPRNPNMVKQTRKQKKAVKKLDKAVRKAVDKGVSAKLVSSIVDEAIADTTNNAAYESEVDAPAQAVAARMPSGNKSTDVTFKRGVVAPAVALKKLPGKRKPPR